MKFIRLLWIGALLPSLAAAQVPKAISVDPMAIPPGITSTVIVHGTGFDGATLLWTTLNADDRRNESVKRAAQSNSVPKTTSPVSTESVQPTDRIAPHPVDVPSDAATGIYGLRVATGNGISNMLLFMVDDLPTTKEVSNQTASASGQRLTLPTGVEGYCDATHADRYTFEVQAGDELSFEVVASRLGTSLDPILKLLDSTGKEIVFADDTPGFAGDCCLRHRFRHAGTYSVTIEDALLGGSSRYRYRLRIGDFPLITTPVPAAVQVGTRARVRFAGYAVGEELHGVSGTAKTGVMRLSAGFPGKSGSGFTQISTSQHPQFVLGGESATVVPVPAGVSGVFAQAGQRHRAFFELRKGQRVVVTDRTRSRGVPAVVAMAVRDTAGKELASVRKAGPSGQSLTWTASSDGRYELLLDELIGRGGKEFGYQVEIDFAQPDFDLSVEKDSSILPQDGYAILKVTANRRGYNGPIQLGVTGLGASPKLGNELIDEKATETRLKVYMPAGRQVGQTQAMTVIGSATIHDRTVQRTAHTIAAFRKVMPQTTFPPVGIDGLVAVSIGPKIPDFFGLSLDGDEILFPRLVGEVYFTVRVEDREPDFKDPVSIRIEGLPAGFSASGGDRAVSRSDNNEYRFLLNGPSAIEPSNGQVRLVGEATHKGQTKEVVLAKVPFRVVDPLLVRAVPDVALGPGVRGRLMVRARRFVPRAGGDQARIIIDFDSIPEGVELPKTAVIPAGKDEVLVDFAIAEDAQLRSPIRVTASTIVGDETVVVTTTVEEMPK